MIKKGQYLMFGSTLVLSMAGASAAPPVTLAELLRDDVKPEHRVYKQVEGRDIALALFRPAESPERKGAPRPAVVCIHGGAWTAGNAEGFLPHARYFASRGAVGISVSYRLLTPGGPTLAETIGDVKSAIRYLRGHAAELGLDPARIAVLGDSAGGHLAACLGTLDGLDDPRDDLTVSARPDAMVLCNPIVDMTDPAWLKYAIGGAALDKHPTPASTQPTAERVELARSFSPVYHVHPGQPPALLMHGLDDRVVLPEQARRFTAAMTEAGNRCDLQLIEGARHAFIVPRYTAPEATVVAAIRAADRFLAGLGFLDGEPTLQASSPPAWSTTTRPSK